MKRFAPGQRVKVVRLPGSYYETLYSYDMRPSVLLLSNRGSVQKRIQAYRNSKGQEHTIAVVRKEGRWTYIELIVYEQNLTFTPCCVESV
jgi:hypothetical protein